MGLRHLAVLLLAVIYSYIYVEWSDALRNMFFGIRALAKIGKHIFKCPSHEQQMRNKMHTNLLFNIQTWQKTSSCCSKNKGLNWIEFLINNLRLILLLWCILTGRPGVLRFMGSQRVGHDWTELNLIAI